MDCKKFRTNLTKLMPGYDWTVHRASKGAARIVATGIQSSGFNRLSTVEVVYSVKDGDWYTVRSAGFGRRAPWLGECSDLTLARALRRLQDLYRAKAAEYGGHERALATGRLVSGDEVATP